MFTSPAINVSTSVEKNNTLPAPIALDAGRIRFGSGLRLPRPVATANTADSGRIRFGSGLRLPRPASTAATADSGRIRFGSGLRLPAAR